MIKNIFDHIWRIIAIILLCTSVILMLIAIFSPLTCYISRKMFYKDVELGSVYEYYGPVEMKNPFKQGLYYIQIIDKKNGYFQYKTYNSYDSITKDDWINVKSADTRTMKNIIEDSDFVEIININYDKERI